MNSKKMKNLNDNQLDDLFKAKFPAENYKGQLAQEYKEKQWKKLARQLYGRKSNRPFMIFLFGLLTIAGLEWIGYNTFGLEDNTRVLSESNNSKNEVLLSAEITDNTVSKETLLYNEQEKITDTSLESENKETSKKNVSEKKHLNKRSVKNSLVSRINEKEADDSKELCNCPDDYIDNKDESNIGKLAIAVVSDIIEENTLSDTYYSDTKSIDITPSNSISLIRKLNAKIEYENENISILDLKLASIVKPKNKNSVTFDISAGVFQDYFFDSIISDTTSVSYYVSTGITLNRKTAFRIEYNEQNIQRGFDEESFGSKSLGIYSPNIDSTISQASAQYKVQSIELSLARHLISIYNIDIVLNPGLQLSNNSEGGLTLENERIYGSEITNYKIDAAPISLNNAFVAMSLEYPISQTVRFQFAYKRYFSLKEQLLPWTQRNRLSAGLTLSF